MLRDILLGSGGATLSRRSLLAGTLALGACGPRGGGLAAAGGDGGRHVLTRPLDLSTPENNVLAYVRLVGDVSGRPSFGWSSGRVYGTREGELSTTLFDYQSVRRVEFRPLDDGSWIKAYRGLILFTDPDTGAVIDAFRNPYTDQDNDVVHFKTAFGAALFTRDGARSLREFESETPESHDSFMMDWSVVGDDAWATYDERIAYRRPDGEWRVDNAVYRYHGYVSELTDPEVTAPYHNWMWSTELNWFTFMKMGERPGHLMWAGMGRKFDRLDAMPSGLIDEAETRYPGFLSDAIDWAEIEQLL